MTCPTGAGPCPGPAATGGPAAGGRRPAPARDGRRTAGGRSAALPAWRWWLLDRRLGRRWRREVAAADARLLAALRERAGVVVASVHIAPTAVAAPSLVAALVQGSVVGGLSVGGGPSAAFVEAVAVGSVFVEVVLADGLAVALGPCHAGAAARLAVEVGTGGPVRLGSVGRNGRLWHVDLRGGDGPLPLLAGGAKVRPPTGGAARPAPLLVNP